MSFPGDYERVTYSLWFRTETRGWQAYGSECSTVEMARNDYPRCVKNFPDAKTTVVRTTVRREEVK